MQLTQYHTELLASVAAGSTRAPEAPERCVCVCVSVGGAGLEGGGQSHVMHKGNLI